MLISLLESFLNSRNSNFSWDQIYKQRLYLYMHWFWLKVFLVKFDSFMCRFIWSIVSLYLLKTVIDYDKNKRQILFLKDKSVYLNIQNPRGTTQPHLASRQHTYKYSKASNQFTIPFFPYFTTSSVASWLFFVSPPSEEH